MKQTHDHYQSIIAGALMLVLTSILAGCQSTQSPSTSITGDVDDEVEAQVLWICSTEDELWKQMPDPELEEIVEPPVVFIKPGRTYQTLDGFGGSFNELGWVALSKTSATNRSAVMEALFGSTGCDFNLARIPIGSSDFAINLDGDPSTPDDDDYSLAMTPEDYELKDFSIDRDRKLLLPYIKAAMTVRPDLQCWASPWSPPEWMKNNEFYAGGHLRWEPKVLQTYADYFSKWIDAYEAEGVNIYAVTPQNEPNQAQVFPSCLYSGDQLAEFIGDYLGPTLKEKNSGIELWLGINGDPQNNGQDINDRIVTVMENPKAKSFLTGMAFQYDSRNQNADAHELYPDKKTMQSESICFNGDNSWGQALELYGLMKRHLNAGANQYFAWNMILDESGVGPWNWRQNAPITVSSSSGKVTYNGEFYVYKHFSHFVKPGAKRVATTGWWEDRLAFVNPDGSIVLVMANNSANDYGASVEVGEMAGNNAFKVAVPARSVNTFVINPN